MRILSDTQKIPSAALAGLLGISERTLRNDIKALNESGEVKIVSSREGYSLQQAAAVQESAPSEHEARAWQVLSDLLTDKEGVNAFDEADHLFVSASTVINTIIPRIKSMVKEYGLSIESHNYQFVLTGSEQNKRRLIGHIATGDTYGFFSTEEALGQLFPQQDIHGIMQELYRLCRDSEFYLNDYSLNNLLVHILVILIRLESDDNLEESENHISAEELLEPLQEKDEIRRLADRISDHFREKFKIQIPERDYQQILILIALSVEHEGVDIKHVISHELIGNVTSILAMMSERYCIPDFDNDFVFQFSLHVYYAYQRCAYQVGYPNPVGSQLKKDYAPVYDMAVFFAHKFSQIYQVSFSEDEIAFIAFHFGAYLENHKQNKERVVCVVVVESYHSFSEKLVNDISEAFKERLLVGNVMPVSRFLRHPPSYDLIISTLPIEMIGQHIVRVSPILTKQNLNDIREKLDEIETERELRHAKSFLRSLFHQELYFRNVALEDETAYINYMGRHCVEHGYVKEGYIQDVLLRESVSSTAFTDALAVPHAINQYAEKSFICVLHNNMPIPWGRKTVHFIFMIGITKQDMKYFKPAFDLIIELFSSTGRTIELLRTGSFEEFFGCMG